MVIQVPKHSSLAVHMYEYDVKSSIYVFSISGKWYFSSLGMLEVLSAPYFELLS